jgi:Acyl-protein synthetase, LuxE
VHDVHERVLRFLDDSAQGSFEDLALQVFAHQFDCCEPYRRHCLAQGRVPGGIVDWCDIPPVPIVAFKYAELSCGPAQRVFLSTGTTAGPELRSRHLIPDLRLYRRSASLGLRGYLFPDCRRMTILSLIPSLQQRPDSSLSQMVAWAQEDFGDAQSGNAVGDDGLQLESLVEGLRSSERSGRPLCLMATSAALIHALDHFAARGLTFRLPHGSRLMDTGGDKGAPRRLSRNGLLHAVWNAFAVPGYFVVNEYGMAELSSQYYDSVVADRTAGRHRPRRKLGPHWTRVVVLSLETLAPVAEGETGLLCHFDLANAGSAMAVLSEDLGRVVDDGFEIVGRAPAAEARGCSLSAAEWQRAETV